MSIITGVGMPEWLVAYILGSMQEWLITIGSTQEHAGVLIIQVNKKFRKFEV